MRYLAADLEDKILDIEPPLITADYPAWVSHPFEGSGEADGAAKTSFRQGKVDLPDTDHIFG
jgi:hypothetical protein